MKKKYNSIDAFIITALIPSATSGISGIMFGKIMNESVTDTYSVKIKLEKLDSGIISSISEGTVVQLTDRETEGKIVGDVISTQSNIVVFDRDSNEFISIEDQDRCDVVITLELEGYYTESGFRISDNSLLLSGMTVSISSPFYKGQGSIIDISDKKQ